jgi:hypothetical protein
MGPYIQYPIKEGDKDKLRKIMVKHPPVREIHPGKVQNTYSIPIPTIHATNINIEKLCKDSDNEKVSHETLDIKNEVLGGSKVSYRGEADIPVSNQIIGTGLEIPTLIHKNAEEALNLNLFDVELRP